MGGGAVLCSDHQARCPQRTEAFAGGVSDTVPSTQPFSGSNLRTHSSKQGSRAGKRSKCSEKRQLTQDHAQEPQTSRCAGRQAGVP